MIKKLFAVIALLAGSAFGQGYYADRALGVNPVGVTPIYLSYAQVRVCTSLDIGTVVTPCSHLATISDISGNPLTVSGGNFGQLSTNVVGQFNFLCPVAQNIWIQISRTGSNTPQLNYATSCGGGGSGGTTVQFQTNGTPNLSQTVFNLVPTGNINWVNTTLGNVQGNVYGDIDNLNSLGVNLFGDTGVVNAYSGCITTNLPNTSGLIINFMASNTNTGASTFALCPPFNAATPILKNNSQAVAAGDINAGAIVTLVSSGTGGFWQLINPAAQANITFKTNGSANISQTVLDIEAGTSINCSNPLGGQVVCNVSGNIAPTVDNLSLTETMAVDNGSANNYSGCNGGTFSPIQQAGLHVVLGNVLNTNTGPSTFTLCSLPTAPVRKSNAAVVAGDIVAGDMMSLVFDGTNWILQDPRSIGASGAFNGQQKGQPTVGLTATTATTEPQVFVAQAFSGADLCAKINAALGQCNNGGTNSCIIKVDATTPGSADVCSGANSNFWSGIGTSVIAKIELNAVLQLKQPVVFPAAAHIVTGFPSNQNFMGGGFRMDPSFTDPNVGTDGCTFGSGDGPFPAGPYKCLIIDGFTNANANAFGGWWDSVLIDCNYVKFCIGYYTMNEQEGSGFRNVHCWHTGSNTGTTGAVNACGFWNHNKTTSGNSGPSHFRIEDSFVDPWQNATGNITNGITYGWVYEANNVNGGGASGGNILISGGTIHGGSDAACAGGGHCYIEDGIWSDGSLTSNFEDLHFEWMNTDAISLHGCKGCKASNITNVNHTSNGVHFYSDSSLGVAYEVSSSGPEVVDDLNGCSNAGSNLEFYTQDDGGQGWWNGMFHVCGSGNQNLVGQITFAAATTGTYTFNPVGTGTAPQCTALPQFNIGTTAYWITTTTTTLTLHTSAATTGTFTYQCVPRGT
jgi:hypothetical protein